MAKPVKLVECPRDAWQGLKRPIPTETKVRYLRALIDDIYQRGLNEHVLVVVGGDFGRTPKISYAASTGEGVASGRRDRLLRSPS